MYLFCISCVLVIFITTVNSCDGCHRRPDEQLPPISWKDCGICRRNCEPNSTFKDPNVSSRIWGGTYASTGDYPYFASFTPIFQKQIESNKLDENVFKLSEGICGGAILNEWWILTAAHCIPTETIGIKNISILVTIGSINRFVGRYLDVERIVIHSTYAKTTDIEHRLKKLGRLIKSYQRKDENKTFVTQLINEYKSVKNEKSDYISRQQNHWFPGCDFACTHYLWDIALVKVKHRIVPVFNETHFKINSICLPKSGITNTRNEKAVIMGMGLTEPNGQPSNLKKGNILILDNSQPKCKERYCAQRLSDPLLNSSHCMGDSGSPIIQYYICRAVQIGFISLISYSKESGDCASSNTSAWLMRVPIFMPWIRWVILSNDIIVISETNVLLILSVITTAIIAVIVSLAFLWITVSILRRRPQHF